MTVEFHVESDKMPVLGAVTRKLSIGLRELLTLALITVLVIIIIVISVMLGQARANKGDDVPEAAAQRGETTPNPSALCVDKLCLDSVSYALSNLKKSINPCTNFYQYACGQYKDLHTADPNEVSSVLLDVLEKNTRRIESILLKSTKQDTKFSSERKVKDYYRSCVDDYTTETLKGGPFISKVLGKMGGAYFLNTWNDSKFSFLDSLNTVQSDFGVSAFWKFVVQMDVTNNFKDRIIEIWPVGISKHLSIYHYLYRTRVADDYKKFMRRMANLLVRDSGVKMISTQQDTLIEQFINDTWSVENQIVTFASTLTATKDAYENENRLSLNDLNSLTHHVVDWVKLAQYMYKGHTVTGSTKVVVHHTKYLEAISDHIKKIIDTNQHRVLYNYLTWRTMETFAQDLSWDYVHANREMYVDVHGQANFLGKKKYCFLGAVTQMPDAVGALFVANHFADKNKQKVTDITKAIKDELLVLLEKTPWMDATTRQLAKNKLSATRYNIGYPDLYRNQYNLNIIYSGLQVNKSDYFGNVLALVGFKRKTSTDELNNGENMDDWYFKVFDTALATVFYLNKIVLPAGLLQFPVYDYQLPHYMTFGSMGTLIGRFLLHLVDEKGSHWDSNNRYLGADKTWWTTQTETHYSDVSKCLANTYNQNQYSHQPDGSLVTKSINGTIYAYQALATTSGIRIAYAAYETWVATHKELMAPNNIGLSNNKMFFLSFAQTWCTSRGSQSMYNLVMSGTPTEEIKVNYALKGLPEFAKAFGCPTGSNMNPLNKCQLY